MSQHKAEECKILVVDDEPDLVELLRQNLEFHGFTPSSLPTLEVSQEVFVLQTAW